MLSAISFQRWYGLSEGASLETTRESYLKWTLGGAETRPGPLAGTAGSGDRAEPSRGVGLTPEILVEPLKVVRHHRSARLRARGPVPDALEAAIDDEPGGNAHVLEPAIELEGVGQRHP